ncbi:MAG: multicomponent Na+:H+ antiporter subunit E [Paraglaciecola sp.]|jgi:multicomponent Na+:H+ antiporter subunit E
MLQVKTFRGLSNRIIIFSFIWMMLSDAQLSSWSVGIFAVAAATCLSMWLSSHSGIAENTLQPRISLYGLAGFMPFFIIQSVKGGIDTARHALAPNMSLAPGFVEYTYRYLPLGRSREVFVNTLSLLPGSLSVEIHSESLLVHFLNINAVQTSDLIACEKKVASLFGHSCPKHQTRPVNS